MFLRSIVFTLFVSSSLFAQVSGKISGTVIDSSGAAIAEASVLLTTQSGATAGSQSTSQSGLFTFAGLQPGTYDVQVERPNFATVKVTGVKVDIAREVALSTITLQPASVGQTVEVTAEPDAVQTANATLLGTVTNSQIARLPQLDRNVISIIKTQPGVGTNNRTPATIHGLRPSYTNITIDGINIQDNYLRENSLDFQPNLLLLDQVAEVTITTSNASSEMGFGAAQVSLATPSGSGQFHGTAFWYNRDSSLAANTWFNNRDGLSDPAMKQNQFGGTLSGPLVRNKLFFHAGYEGLRLRRDESQQRTILTDSARQGIFTYTDQSGNVQQRNILALKGIEMDPVIKSLMDQIPGGGEINNFRIGDSSEGALRNTGGYTFLSRRDRYRTNVTGKLDYYVSEKHSLFGTYLWNSDMNDRPGLTGTTYDHVPVMVNDNKINLASVGWNSTWSPTFTNELRGGFNFAPGDFSRRTPEQPANFTKTLFSSPYDPYPPNGRTSRTFNLSDNAKWVKGNHTISFGFQLQHTRQNVWDTQLNVPTYAIGLSTAAGVHGLTAADLPGISAANLSTANSLFATLGGYLTSGEQRQNAITPSSGFVPGSPARRIWETKNYAGYIQDNWKLNRRLNLTLGIRYEYQNPVREIQGMALQPVIENNNAIASLLNPNGRIEFARQPMYNPDRNNFAPNIGLAWDITGDSKTVFRAGYSINYVNDNLISTIQNGPLHTSGLQTLVTNNYNTSPVRAGNAPVIPTAPYKVPRTHADNYAINIWGNTATFDPHLRMPYVQQWSAGIQRSFWGGVIDVRYAGNRATKMFRALDYNQVDVNTPGLLTDFRNAYNNGVLAMENGRPFNPTYNPAIAGSQALPFFDSMLLGSFLTHSAITPYIQQQEIGEFIHVSQSNGLNAPYSFRPNPMTVGANLLTNNGYSTYHAAQIDYTRRFARGFSVQANYVFAKSLSDTSGDNQANFEPYLDQNNPKIEKAPTIFDLRHAFKANFVIELPFGKGKKFLQNTNPVASQILGGWSLSGMTMLQSGTPFSILSGRGTLNRSSDTRSRNNTATTSLNGGELNQIVSYYMTGRGPYMIAQSAINTDGRGVAGDGRPNFNGQVFTNPNAGEIGTLQRRMFTGPRFFNMDAGVQKAITVAEGHFLEFRMEAINVFNNVMYGVPDMNINSASFGRITQQANSPRRVQFGLYYRF